MRQILLRLEFKYTSQYGWVGVGVGVGVGHVGRMPGLGVADSLVEAGTHREA